MMRMSKYPQIAQSVEAIYHTPIQQIYVGNPVIEALPETMPPEKIVDALKYKVPYSSTERELPAYERKECVSALFHCFEPWGEHIILAQKVGSAIKSGYVARNPLNPEHISALNVLSECVQARDAQFLSFTSTNASAAGFSIIGLSGIGKTTSINRVLSLFPQIINHTQYGNLHFPYKQIVWMKLECPFDGSVKGLCSNFFQEFDRLTGDNTYAKYAAGGRVTVDAMIPQMALISRRHSLGLLVIDEIQHISAAKSGGIEKMLNFITNLVNTIGVPVVLIGIPEAIDIISSSFVLARRSSGQQGIVFLKNLVGGSADWTAFLQGIWRYQWTAVPTELSVELRQVFAQESAGIADVVIKLYARVQQLAIQRGEHGKSEEITPDLVGRVANSDDFRLLKKRLDVLQKKSKSN